MKYGVVFVIFLLRTKSQELPVKELQDMTLEDFINIATSELLGGKNLVNNENNANFVEDETKTGKTRDRTPSRTSIQAQSGSNSGSRRNAEVARRLGSDRPSDRGDVSSTRTSKSEQEKLLRDYGIVPTDSYIKRLKGSIPNFV